MTRDERTILGILVSLILFGVICISYHFGRYVQSRIDIDAISELQEYYVYLIER